MRYCKAKSLIRQNRMYYAAGLLMILGIKYYYSKAGSNDLEWILSPTAWWVRILTGIPFEYDPAVGYISYSYRFIIAPSCSGVQFMTVAIATLVFSFVHRMRTARGKAGWIGLSLGVSYLFTIFVNGFRIVLSIYLPIYLRESAIGRGWITPERLHTLTGIAVYFTSLFIMYQIAGHISWHIGGVMNGNTDRIMDGNTDRIMDGNTDRIMDGNTDRIMDGNTDRIMNGNTNCNMNSNIVRRCLPPVFWYFFIVLGIPLLNRAYVNNGNEFLEYAALMTAVCLAIVSLFCAVSAVRRHFFKGWRSCAGQTRRESRNR